MKFSIEYFDFQRMLLLLLGLLAFNVGNSDIFWERDEELFRYLTIDINFNRIALQVFRSIARMTYLELQIREEKTYQMSEQRVRTVLCKNGIWQNVDLK